MYALKNSIKYSIKNNLPYVNDKVFKTHYNSTTKHQGYLMLKQKINKWLYEKSINFMRKQARVDIHTMKVEGYTIAYLESKNKSNKKTLILQHGNNDEKDTWLMVASALKDKYHLIMIDLLGCGDSSLPMDFDYSVPSQADFLHKVITQLTKEKEIKTFSLAGQSLGGGLAILLANRLPIEKLILIDALGLTVKTSKFIDDGIQIGNIDKLPWLNIESKEQLRSFAKDAYYKAPYMPSFILEHFVEKKKPIANLEKKKFFFIVDDKMLPIDDFSHEISQIKPETLIIWGEEDQGIDVANAYKMHKLIDNSTLKIYPKCGHMLHAEKPKELVRDIVAFLG
jgi:triacylglycerol lipase